MPGKIKGKQLEDLSLSLNLLSGQGSAVIGSASQFQIVGSALNPDDVVSKKDLDQAISGLTGVGGQLAVEDYNTGASFSNVQKMIFRGNVITPDGQMGVLADNSTGEPNTVTVWIPAPEYVDYFSPTLFGGSQRLLSNPTTNSYNPTPGNSGEYDIGDWNAGDTILATNNGSINAFTDSEFALFNESTTMDFIVYGADNTTVLDQMSITINGDGVFNSTSGNLTITITNYGSDSDRFKCGAVGSIDLNSLLPNGGRFSFLVRHNNGQCDGNVSLGVYEFERLDRFYDNDYVINSGSSAEINGNVTIEENVPNLNIISGVAYYGPGSTFTASVFEMDNLNEITYPGVVSGNTDNIQLRLNFTQMNIGQQQIAPNDSNFIGWTNDWNVQNVDYVNSFATTGNTTIPGLNSVNDFNTSGESSLTARIWDWDEADIKNSDDYKFMFYAPSSTSSRNFEDFVDESWRLDINENINNTNDVSVDSTDTLISKTLELQQTFGRLVFPKLDFTPWGPNYNNDNNIDYSLLSGNSLTLDVITDIDTLTTTSVTHNEYRWYLRRFETGGSTQTMGNGTFEFDTNFVESDLDLTNDGNPGDGNLLLYMGLTNDSSPTSWYDLSRNPSNTPQGPRANATGVGSSNLNDNGEIAWNTATVSGWTCYLLIGIKENVPGNEKRIESIRIKGGTWD